MPRTSDASETGRPEDDEGRLVPNPPGRMGSAAEEHAETKPRPDGRDSAAGDADPREDLGKGYGRSETAGTA